MVKNKNDFPILPTTVARYWFFTLDSRTTCDSSLAILICFSNEIVDALN